MVCMLPGCMLWVHSFHHHKHSRPCLPSIPYEHNCSHICCISITAYHIRGCTGEFSTRKSKELFISMYTTKIGQVGRIERDFSQYPALANFIEHHVHQNRPPWERILNDTNTSSWHWWRSCTWGHHFHVQLCCQNCKFAAPSGEIPPTDHTTISNNDDKSSTVISWFDLMQRVRYSSPNQQYPSLHRDPLNMSYLGSCGRGLLASVKEVQTIQYGFSTIYRSVILLATFIAPCSSWEQRDIDIRKRQWGVCPARGAWQGVK